jgi:nitrogen-specific signal transduction histidine kinase/CheY-like chemotaxis protein
VLLDDDGSPVRLFGTNQDITESKRAQEEAVERQKLETVGTLANGMAHDFNNLLGGILAHAELALVQLAGGSQPEAEIKAICESAVRGSEIVRQLMIYAGTENEPLHSVDLSQIVEEMVDLLKFSVSKHATLITNIGKDLPAVQASAGQLRQIVMNLVTNASEAIGDRHGVIRVTTECVAVGHDQTRFTSEDVADGKYLKLEVSDTGCGMSPETQGKIFDPFYTTKSAGHGLGLAVVQGTVRSLHGTIRVESQPGEGTTFEILLPSTRKPATVSPMSPKAESARSRQEITVLIVEDEDSLRLPVLKLMRKAGFSVLEAADGAAAIEVIRAHNSRIDVLLLDITLPGTPSGEVLQQATHLRPDMSVFVTSAYTKDFAEEKLGRKVQCFVRKPYQLQDLLQLVRQSVG